MIFILCEISPSHLLFLLSRQFGTCSLAFSIHLWITHRGFGCQIILQCSSEPGSYKFLLGNEANRPRCRSNLGGGGSWSGLLEFVRGRSIWASLILGSLSSCVCSWSPWRVMIWARSWLLWHVNVSSLWATFSRSRAASSQPWSDWICCSFISTSI